jgi:hemerythrin
MIDKGNDTAPFIQWLDEYTVGHPQLDAQHKQIVGIINDLYRILREKGGALKLDSIGNRLKSYTAGHLTYEIKLLTYAQYPDIDAHRRLHDSIVEKTAGMLASVERREKDAAGELLRFLKQWWLDHIRNEDRKYEQFVKKVV